MPVFGQLEEFASAKRSVAPPRQRRKFELGEFLTGLRRNVGPVLRASVHVVVVVDLVQLGAVGTGAFDGGVDVAIPHQRFADLGVGVRLCATGHDARVLEERVRVQDREQLECLLEVIDHLLRGHIVGVAGGVEGADAGAMLAPFVLPERLVVALIVFPVHRHVVQQVVAVEVLEDLRDVFVLAAFVAELLVGSVAFVGPAERPAVSWGWRLRWRVTAYHRPWTVQ